MSVSTFKRGLKLDTRKHATEGKAIENVPKLDRVVIPINQHFGAPNKVIVAEGDRVKRGQRIAEGNAPGPMTVPVHASISGIVKKIENRPQSNNAEGLCVIIEGDGENEDIFMPPLDPFTCTKEEAIERVRDAGIIGMGGAGFPTHVKLSPPSTKTIDFVIANGAECEPYITSDEALMEENPTAILKGISIAMKITGAPKGIVGIETSMAGMVPNIEKEIAKSDYPNNIKVQLCKILFPQGSEKMLITAITGREVPSGGLPMDAGCIVSNVGTLAAIAEAFTLGKPLIERGLTVSGGACREPRNIRTPIGTVITDLPKEFVDIDYERLRKVIIGGPMMGVAVPTLGVPVQKNTSGILFLTEEELLISDEQPCIRCCRCIHNCSLLLSPVIMNTALNCDDFDEAVSVGLLDCMECGSCSFMCPARIKLTQRFRVGKQRYRILQASRAKA
ncbi:MAG: electron transport complex subunit RsxC [Treponema sp.]|nr:electron transport complex subunit RsxC [Treponema sp.]